SVSISPSQYRINTSRFNSIHFFNKFNSLPLFRVLDALQRMSNLSQFHMKSRRQRLFNIRCDEANRIHVSDVDPINVSIVDELHGHEIEHRDHRYFDTVYGKMFGTQRWIWNR